MSTLDGMKRLALNAVGYLVVGTLTVATALLVALALYLWLAVS